MLIRSMRSPIGTFLMSFPPSSIYRALFFDVECCHSRINGTSAELLLDAKKLIVFSDTL